MATEINKETTLKNQTEKDMEKKADTQQETSASPDRRQEIIQELVEKIK